MGTFLNFSDLSPYAPSMTADQAEGYIAGIVLLDGLGC